MRRVGGDEVEDLALRRVGGDEANGSNRGEGQNKCFQGGGRASGQGYVLK